MPATHKAKASSVLESDVKAADITTACAAAQWAHDYAVLNNKKRLDCISLLFRPEPTTTSPTLQRNTHASKATTGAL